MPRELDESALEVKRLELETTLNQMTIQADDAVKRET